MHTHGWSASSSPTTSPSEESSEFVTRFLTLWLQTMSTSAAIQRSVWDFTVLEKVMTLRFSEDISLLSKSVTPIFTIV